MVRSFPVGVLVVGIAEACHAERRCISERSAKVNRSGACADRHLERINDPASSPSSARASEPRRPTGTHAVAGGRNNSGSWLAASSHSAIRSTGWRQSVNSRRRGPPPSGRRQSAAEPPRAPSRSGRGIQCLVDEVEPISGVGANARSFSREQGVGEDEPARRLPQSPSSRVRSAAPRDGARLSNVAASAWCGRIRPTSKTPHVPPRRLAVAVRRHAARAVEQGEIGFLLLHYGRNWRAPFSRETYAQPSRFCAPNNATCRTMSACVPGPRADHARPWRWRPRSSAATVLFEPLTQVRRRWHDRTSYPPRPLHCAAQAADRRRPPTSRRCSRFEIRTRWSNGRSRCRP